MLQLVSCMCRDTFFWIQKLIIMDDDPFAKQISFHAQIYEIFLLKKLLQSLLSLFGYSSFQLAGEFLMHGLLALLYHLQTYAKLLHQFHNHLHQMQLQFLVSGRNELKISLKLKNF